MVNLAVGTEVFDKYCTSTNSTLVAKCAKPVESHNKRILSAKGKYPVEWQYVSITFECKHFGTYKITKASRLEKGKCKSRKLSDAEKKYSAFDRELLASYSAVKHFRHFLEGRPFTLYTDHKPLTFALSSETDRSPRQTRYLAFIAEFTTDIRHIKGKFNVVADALSRITTTSNAADTINLCPVSISHPVEVDWTDFAQLAKDQIQSGEMASYRTATTGLILKDIDIGPSTLFCDTSLGVTRPVLPVSWTRPVFNKIHGLSHPGVRPTQKAIAQRFVWHGMKRDIRQWCKECPDCQVSKIHRHTHSALTKRPQPSDRFRSLHVDLVGPLPESHGMTYLFTVIDRFFKMAGGGAPS
ncbi:hypothetical protein PoB_007151300 [Plakobranchus ocellatus]|uniref:Integrase zinc-binding domain-containing protein n=1 Tax=Plakobranchus ocellatus TaxID=259542 RepID=A0AAV4DLU9_9GAST|nr:hypothetical protein PoB_007151300 [Plakobranchus ocellatus]